MSPHPVRLLGLATAVPAVDIDQETATELARPLCAADEGNARALAVLYRRSRVRRRACALLLPGDVAGGWASLYRPRQSHDDPGPSTAARMACFRRLAPPLASRAARAALADAAIDGRRITHVVTVCCTGFMAPGLDHVLIEQLGLARDVGRTHVGFMGCHGLVNGLAVARGLAAAHPGARVLLCAVELSSLHFQYGWEPERVLANALFADGAAAIVLGGDASEGAGWAVAATGSHVLPDSAGAMSWQIGDHGFRMTLSPRVPDLIGEQLPGWLDGWLERSGTGRGEVGCWAIHPGGPRIVDAVAGALELSTSQTEASLDVLAAHGNMSSPTIAFILDALRARGAQPPCVALAFGPGLQVEAALLA